ncbi:uncharacterized protein [Eurosta solidaginis]|uniref:uncharacterized protein isoform X4 n=1 Tax=Eurosta solidaginis TaxID=178769 RepID=UPI0035315576
MPKQGSRGRRETAIVAEGMGFGKNFLILRHASVGIEELRYLTETDLCQIFPSVEVVGTKAKLREKIKLWKKDECDIQTILPHYPRGKDSLEYYEDQKRSHLTTSKA